ncbi:acyl-CoA dehydrogenase family protein [Paracraurococcus ruber]|uniref:acyl-CoA dehydrogenase family protein n=2 Tax=Paracraurococcus ruber TaxID=77675 RepID=UPI001305350B|nr:acyl-CoA dehydrogenase family protein [Paracraurococcus ruber]
MPFDPRPMLPGDAYDAARRFAEASAATLAPLHEPAARAAELATQWAALLELGWPGMLVPEAQGGAGGTLLDLAALAEGAGSVALALPLAACCGVAPTLLAGQDALLAELAAGRLQPCVALAGGITLEAGRLSGRALGVETPPRPSHALLAVEDALYLLDLGTPGAAFTRHERIDGRLTLDLDLQGASAQLLAAEAGTSVARACDLGALLSCVEAVAAMGTLIRQTIDYLLQRQQFGTALASFQALRHRVAEMYVAWRNLTGLVQAALREPGWENIAFAKLRLGEAGRFVAEQAIQVHGGMGMTEELPATRLARRILMAEFEWGDRHVHAARLLAAA